MCGYELAVRKETYALCCLLQPTSEVRQPFVLKQGELLSVVDHLVIRIEPPVLRFSLLQPAQRDDGQLQRLVWPPTTEL